MPRNRSRRSLSQSPQGRASKERPGNTSPSRQGGRLRIVGGEWRSRQLPVATVEGLRPTPDRIRETLYNWLTGWVAGSHCLDAFAGTGALGLEALSRGAASATFLEFSPLAARLLQQNLELLKCTKARVEQTDARHWLSAPAQKSYDLVFLDPPFHKGMVAPVCQLLNDNGYLSENALVYIEVESSLTTLELPAGWQLWKEKTAGQVSCRLYRAGSALQG